MAARSTPLLIRYPLAVLKNLLHITPYPSFCTFIVTWKCNAKCIMCDVWKKEPSYEMNLQEIDAVFARLKQLDAVRISGGEPFIRQDLADIVNVITKRVNPKIIHVTTNGFLKDRILHFIERIDEPGRLHIKISIDGVGEEYDGIRGVSAASKIAFETLAALSKVREKYGFYLGVNQTIVNAENAGGYHKLKDICASYNVKLYPVMAYKESAIYKKEQNINLMPSRQGEFSTFGEFSEGQLLKMLDLLQKDASGLDNFIEKTIKKYYLRGIFNRLVLKKDSPNPACAALKSHLRIFPNGDVPVCLFNSHIAGNLLEKTFKEIWFGKDIAPYRKMVEQCPGCWAECETAPSAVYSGDIVKALI